MLFMVTLLWVNTPLPPKIWNVTKATTKTRRTGSWTVWDPLICFPVIHFYYHDIQLQINHYNYIILYTVSTVSALVGIALVHHVQNDGFQWVLRLKWSNVGWFGIPLWLRTPPQNRCPKEVGNFTGSAICHSVFFCSSFFSHSGHVPKHNHLCFFFCSSFFSHMAMCPNTIISLSLSFALVLSKTMFQKALRKFGESKWIQFIHDSVALNN
jgi:hypothetical protein